MKGVRIFYALAKKLKQEDYFEIVKEIIKKIDDISLISQVVSIQTGRGEKKDKSKDKTFNLKQEKELQKLILGRLDLNFILRSQYTIYLIFLVKDWSKILFAKIKKEISNKINNNKFCLDFVSRFITSSKSQTIGSNYVHTEKRISKKSLFEIVDEKQLMKKLNDINNTESQELLGLINKKDDFQ